MIHSLREQRRRETEVRICDAVLHLVQHGSLGALTMARIAEQVGISAGALYRYHTSKDALIASVQARILDDWDAALAAMGPRVQAAAEDPLQQVLLPLVGAVQLYSELPDAQPGPFALMSRILADPAPLIPDEIAMPTVMPSMLQVLGRVAGWVDAAQGPVLSPGPSDERAFGLFAAIQGVLQLEKLERLAPTRFSAADLALGVGSDLLVGWGATIAQVSAARASIATLAPLLESP